MSGFKYYIGSVHRGWEVTDGDGEVMGIYCTEAEAHAAISHFVERDVEAAIENRGLAEADHRIDQRKHER